MKTPFNKNQKTILCMSLAVLFCFSPYLLNADPLDKIAKKLSEGAKDLKNKKVAVLPLPYHDGRDSEGSTVVSERLTTKIVEEHKLQVVERSLLEKVLKELKLESSGAIDDQSAKQLGKVLGVEAIVSGTLIDLGGKEVEVNARLINAESGEIIVAASGNVDKVWNDTISPGGGAKDNANPPVPSAPTPSVQTNAGSEDMSNHPQQPLDIQVIVSGLPKDILNGPAGTPIRNGFDLLKNRNATDALRQFKMLHDQNQGNKRVEMVIGLGLSLSFFQQGNNDRAMSIANRIASLAPKFPYISGPAHYILGEYAERSGNLTDAKDRYLEVVRLIPLQIPIVKSAGQKLKNLK